MQPKKQLRGKLAFFYVNFILQKFCPCKKNDKFQVWEEAIKLKSPRDGDNRLSCN